MHVLVTGGSGFIGSAVTEALRAAGHAVTVVDLRPPVVEVPFRRLDLTRDEIPPTVLDHIDAIIHLAGRSLFTLPTAARKTEMVRSRLESTRRLVEAIGRAARRPQVLVSASAVGYYGDRGEAEITEATPPGSDFLATLCAEWERAARGATSFGVRTVHLRLAPVLGPGGLLRVLLPFFRAGLGGPVGNGEQWFPWIHRADVVGIILFAVTRADLRDAINACAPEQVRQREFAAGIARILGRPARVRLPQWIVQQALRDLASTVTASLRVSPHVLAAAGYPFHFPSLGPALAEILSRTP